MKQFDKHIIITGSARSGTSWLSELLARQFRYRMLFEPEHEFNTEKGKLLCDRWIKNREEALQAHQYLKRVFKNRVDSDWIEVLAARWAGAKWIYTKKAMSWGNRHWKIRSYLANFIISINDEMRDYFPNKRNQKLIPLGIDTDYYNPALFPNNKTSDKIFNIITVANLVPVKGVEVLINAIKSLNNPNIKLTILGDYTNEYGQYLKSFCNELRLGAQVEFKGKKMDVRPYIAASDLYVIPTLNEGRKEGMPMALVEAMSMGIPVLGSNISGINFVLKDYENLLFEAKNESQLAQKIQWLMDLQNIKREALGTDLRNYVVQNFSYQNFIGNHEDLYAGLIK